LPFLYLLREPGEMPGNPRILGDLLLLNLLMGVIYNILTLVLTWGGVDYLATALCGNYGGDTAVLGVRI